MSSQLRKEFINFLVLQMYSLKTQEAYLRIIYESWEDYLYPENYFVIVQLLQEAQK